jgi:alpha-D-xyloside xylohydrolase
MDNYTMMRALTFDFRNDANVYNVPDQYMFGPAFLVNPVTEQLYTATNTAPGEKTRKVYLPKSTAWYDFWTGQVGFSEK